MTNPHFHMEQRPGDVTASHRAKSVAYSKPATSTKVPSLREGSFSDLVLADPVNIAATRLQRLYGLAWAHAQTAAKLAGFGGVHE